MSMPPSVEATIEILPGGAIDEHREVEFLGDIDAVGDVQAIDLLARIAGLDGDERVAEHVGRGGADLVLGLGEADAALGIGTRVP